MHVAIVTHNVIRGDGQGRVNYEFARYLLRQGAEVTLVADRVEEDLLDSGAKWIPVHPRFDSIDLLKVWRFRRLADRAVGLRLDAFDAVVACGVVLDVPHYLNIAHFVHGTWLTSPFHASKVRRGFDAAYQWLYTRLNASWEKRVFDQARIVGAVSAMVRDELVEIGVEPDRIRILGNGVDIDEFAPGSVDRSSLGLPGDVPIALFVGDIQSPIKNLDAVLKALTRVPNLHLAVAGRIGASPYPAMAERFGIDSRVHFLDFRRDIADLMRAADFFVLVSRRDSCPLVVLEALSSGLPVITTKTVGNWDLVGRRAGFVTESPDDIDALVHAMRELTTNSHDRASLAIEARRVGLENAWDGMSRRYHDVIRNGVIPGVEVEHA